MKYGGASNTDSVNLIYSKIVKSEVSFFNSDSLPLPRSFLCFWCYDKFKWEDL
jgi:hypothetical protein